MLSDKAIKEFQELYKKVFGEDISLRDAEQRAEKLLGLFRVVSRPPIGKDAAPGPIEKTKH